MDQTALERVDLAILEDHVAHADARDIEREHGVNTRIRPEDRGEILQLGNRGDAFASAAVNHDRDLALGTKPTVRILVTGFLLLSLYYDFLSHNSPGSKFKVPSPRSLILEL